MFLREQKCLIHFTYWCSYVIGAKYINFFLFQLTIYIFLISRSLSLMQKMTVLTDRSQRRQQRIITQCFVTQPSHLSHSVCGAKACCVPGEDAVLVGTVQVIWWAQGEEGTRVWWTQRQQPSTYQWRRANKATDMRQEKKCSYIRENDLIR